MLKISVIITTYNDFEYLEPAINSVINQKYDVHQILVIDDGSSTKGAQDAISKINSSGCNIEYYYKDNGGPSSARNYGVSKATGEYIAFLDVDDVWLPNHLSHKVKLLDSCSYRNKLFGIFGSFIFSDTKLTRKFFEVKSVKSNNHLVSRVGREEGIPGGLPSYLINKQSYLNVGGFDESLTINEDFDLIIRLLSNGYLTYGDNEPGFIRTMRDDSLTRNNNHHLTYSRTTPFFVKAKKNQYFSSKELRRRRSFAAFSTSKKILREDKFDFSGYRLLFEGILIMLRVL